jgi:hypothetical protein
MQPQHTPQALTLLPGQQHTLPQQTLPEQQQSSSSSAGLKGLPCSCRDSGQAAAPQQQHTVQPMGLVLLQEPLAPVA